MTEAELKAKADAEEKARADAEGPPWAKNLKSAVDACMSRMDSVESLFKNDKTKKADAEEEEKAAAEKAKADAEEEEEKAAKEKADAEEAEAKENEEAEAKAAEVAADKKKADEEEEKKADAVRADAVRKAVAAETADLRKLVADQDKRLASLTGAVHITDDDRAALAEIQSRADTVASAFGKRASQPMAGETAVAYRRRLAAQYKSHSPSWKDVDLAAIDGTVLKIAEDVIYADALTAASHPADLPAGQLREIVKQDRTGRKISEFVGNKSAWMDQFKATPQLMIRINKEA